MLVPVLCALGALSAAPDDGRSVLVIVNERDPDSVKIGQYYAQKRKVPTENIVLTRTAVINDVPQAGFERDLATPIRAALAASKNPIKYLLFVRGVPIRIKESRNSIDSVLASEKLPRTKIQVGELAQNPYFGKNEPFSVATYGYYLACRLDGYTVADTIALIDRSLAAKPSKGPFFFDKADNRKAASYGKTQETLDRAFAVLKGKGFQAELEDTATFAAPAKPLAGYASWGSNDGKFDADAYHRLKFLPGALAETFVSTSGRTFRPTTGGQSLIADLIAQGVTGVKGYVSEPYTIAMAHPDLLFDAYTSGRTLGESFYAASMVLYWKDVVIGDPLCAPYRK